MSSSERRREEVPRVPPDEVGHAWKQTASNLEKSGREK